MATGMTVDREHLAEVRDHYRQALDGYRQAGVLREERVIHSAQAAEIRVEYPAGAPVRCVLNFCSNNYLGLSSHPEVVKAAHEGLEHRGYGMSSVRFICGTQDIHRALEHKLTEFLGTEDTLLFPSCMDANAGVFEWAVKLTPMNNHGNFIISLGQLTPWLAQQAEQLGVDVFPGFAAAEALYDEQGAVHGVRIGDMGLQTDGTPGPNYTPGVEIRAPTTILAEGSRGSITKQLIAKFNLREGVDPPTFGLGFKELSQLPPGRVQPGRIEHAFGWPLDKRTYGGSFLYHLDQDRAYVGYVVGLNYQDPRLKPFEAFQQFKHHPRIKPLLEAAAGARDGAALVIERAAGHRR